MGRHVMGDFNVKKVEKESEYWCCQIKTKVKEVNTNALYYWPLWVS